jgi:hypothetical protein
MMIAINVFAMVCLLVMQPGLVFFEKYSFIDYLMKLLLIAGGGVSLKQAMALIGNLISNGAGSNELRDAAIAGGLGGLMGKIPGAGFLGAIGGAMKQEIVGKAAQKVLPYWAQRSYGNGTSRGGGSKGEAEKGSDSKNSNAPTNSANNNTAKKAIQGGANDKKPTTTDNKKTENTNNNKPDGNGIGKGNNLVDNAINNREIKSDGYDDLYD